MKKLIFFSLVLMSIAALLCSCGYKDETYYQYEVNDDGTLTIISISETYSKTLKIPQTINGQTVTRIGKFAFYNNDYIRKIVLPDSVTTIEECAFADSNKLKTVVLGAGCKEIGLQAFEGCDALKTVDMSKSALVAIGDLAFHKCMVLKSFDPPATLETIGIGAFDNCEQLIVVTDKSEVAANFATEHNFPTDFSDTDNFLITKIIVYTALILGAILIVSYLMKKRKNKS